MDFCFEGGHDINCREINWVVGCEVSSVRTVGHDMECRVVFRGSIFFQFRRMICHDTRSHELFQEVGNIKVDLLQSLGMTFWVVKYRGVGFSP